MRSPFPGMDPYLEDPAVWYGFHGELVYTLREFLLDRLPAPYDGVVDENRRQVPGEPEWWTIFTPTGEPTTVQLPGHREIRHRWIEVRSMPRGPVVTVIEVLSPWT